MALAFTLLVMLPLALGCLLFVPLGRLPGGRQQMLRTLTGTRSGWFGRWPLPVGFLEALARR